MMAASFAVLLYFGYEVYLQKPPIPAQIITESGEVIFTGEEIIDGQSVWQSIGGQEVGSIWGHGAYVAPDWSADWLHREALHMLEALAIQKDSIPYNDLPSEDQAYLQLLLQKDLRKNTYDEAENTIVISDLRADAIKANMDYYKALFTDDPEMDGLRENYAIRKNSVKDEIGMDKMNAFFFWTSWACVTQRPGKEITYTSNWPHEPLVGNKPTSPHLFWSFFSIVILLIGIGLLAFYYARNQDKEEIVHASEADPLIDLKPTPSM